MKLYPPDFCWMSPAFGNKLFPLSMRQNVYHFLRGDPWREFFLLFSSEASRIGNNNCIFGFTHDESVAFGREILSISLLFPVFLTSDLSPSPSPSDHYGSRFMQCRSLLNFYSTWNFDVWFCVLSFTQHGISTWDSQFWVLLNTEFDIEFWVWFQRMIRSSNPGPGGVNWIYAHFS